MKIEVTNDEIAKEAYLMWEKAGRPNGEQLDVCGKPIREYYWEQEKINVKFDKLLEMGYSAWQIEHSLD